MSMSDVTALTKAKEMGLQAFTAVNNPFLADAKKEGVTDGFWLRMNGKTGVWLCNLPNQNEIEPGTELVFDIFHAEKLWQGFDTNNKLFNGPKVTILSGRELPDPPPTPNVTWKKHVRIMVATTDGGRQMSMICKADNPYREVLKLVKRYGELFTKFPDATSKSGFRSPVVKISSVSYDMTAKIKKVVPNKATGVDEMVEVEQKLTNFREVFTITDNLDDWITQAEMENILVAAGNAPAEAAVEQIAAEESKNAADYVDTTPKADKPATVTVAVESKVVEAEIIPPAAKAPTPEVSSFRRNRAGQTGIRTA